MGETAAGRRRPFVVVAAFLRLRRRRATARWADAADSGVGLMMGEGAPGVPRRWGLPTRRDGIPAIGETAARRRRPLCFLWRRVCDCGDGALGRRSRQWRRPHNGGGHAGRAASLFPRDQWGWNPRDGGDPPPPAGPSRTSTPSPRAPVPGAEGGGGAPRARPAWERDWSSARRDARATFSRRRGAEGGSRAPARAAGAPRA